MPAASLLVALGLANWIATMIVVESELFRPIRTWARRRHHAARYGPTSPGPWGLIARAWHDITGAPPAHPARAAVWGKVRYLLGCHLCTGVWIAVLMAPLVPARPLGGGVAGVVLLALAIKGVGHLVLELVAVAQAAGARLASGTHDDQAI